MHVEGLLSSLTRVKKARSLRASSWDYVPLPGTQLEEITMLGLLNLTRRASSPISRAPVASTTSG